MATIKEQDIVLVSKESDGTKVIQMPITRVENVEGGIATVNGIKPDSSKNVAITKVAQADNATRATSADSATKATQDGNGKVISSTYATKAELGTKLDTNKAFTKAAADNLYLGKTDTAVAATKALQDNLGNNISDTYATKSNLIPLAKDSEVLKLIAQTLTPEQKAQVVKNLEGTFFPLGGGTVTGAITTSYNRALKKHNDSSEMVICGGTDINDGGWLGLFGQNYEDARKGGFSLVAKDKSLQGIPSGSLTWDAKEVDRVNSSGYGWIRYENGLQFCWGQVNLPTNQATYPVPFKNWDFVVITPQANFSTYASFTCSSIQTGLRVFFDASSLEGSFSYLAIGLWK